MPASGGVDLYGASYRNFASALYADIRREAFGDDIGQTGWLTAEEQDLFIAWLGLSRASHLLDVACGSGTPTLRIAQKTGCRVSGVDLHDEGIASAKASAKELGCEERTDFYRSDAAERLAFEDRSFDAITCIDAINHLPDRPRVLEEWHRLLKPGGRLLFTDPIVLTGPVTNREVAIRASIGLFVFVPAGLDQTMLEQAGFEVERVEDRTQNMAANAGGWFDARARRESDLRAIEGDEAFDGQQQFSRPLPSSPGRSGSRASSYWHAGRPGRCADLVAQIESRRLGHLERRSGTDRAPAGLVPGGNPHWRSTPRRVREPLESCRPGQAPRTAHS